VTPETVFWSFLSGFLLMLWPAYVLVKVTRKPAKRWKLRQYRSAPFTTGVEYYESEE